MCVNEEEGEKKGRDSGHSTESREAGSDLKKKE